MRKTFLFLLAASLLLMLGGLPIPVSALDRPVITGVREGEKLQAGTDTLFTWQAVSGAEYYTVALRWLGMDGDNGPLVEDSTRTTDCRYLFSGKNAEKYGFGNYRICISAVSGGERVFSQPITFCVSSPLTGKKIVAFGDSLTAAGSWEKALETRFATTVINAGKGGDTSVTAAGRFESQVLAQNPDILLLLFCYNDAVRGDHLSSRVPLATFRAQMLSYITRAQAAGIDVILFTPNPPVPDAFNANPAHPGADYDDVGGFYFVQAQYRAVLRDISARTGAGFVDLFGEFEALGDDSLIEPAGVHPVEAGYAVYARKLGDFLAARYCDASLTALQYRIVVNGMSVRESGVLSGAPGALLSLSAAGFPNTTGIDRIAVFGEENTVMLSLRSTVTGDIDGSGNADARDYLLLRRALLGAAVLNEDSAFCADIDASDDLSARDYLLLRRTLLGA